MLTILDFTWPSPSPPWKPLILKKTHNHFLLKTFLFTFWKFHKCTQCVLIIHLLSHSQLPSVSLPTFRIIAFSRYIEPPCWGIGRLMACAPRSTFLLDSNGCFLESMTVVDWGFSTRRGSMCWRRERMRWAGVWAVCKDLCHPLQPCDSNDFTVLAELRKCGLTESETCLKTVTLNLDRGKTVSIAGRAGRSRSWVVERTCSHWQSPLPSPWIHILNSEHIHYLWVFGDYP